MEKINFKFGLALGFLISANLINFGYTLFNLVQKPDFFWILNGVITVLLLFFHAMCYNEVISSD